MIYVISEMRDTEMIDVCYTYDKGAAYQIARLVCTDNYSVSGCFSERYAKINKVPYCEKLLQQRGIQVQ